MRIAAFVALLAAAAALPVLPTNRAAAQAPRAEPGWTGLSNPAGVIAARQSLMHAIEELMKPIDAYAADLPSAGTTSPPAGGAADGPGDGAASLPENAAAIAAMLEATPHLYPPTTNLYDAKSDAPATLALPRIWESFDAFAAIAASSVVAARSVAEASEPGARRAGAAKLRAACDACHALFLRPYVPSTVTEEDKEVSFDFGN